MDSKQVFSFLQSFVAKAGNVVVKLQKDEELSSNDKKLLCKLGVIYKREQEEANE